QRDPEHALPDQGGELMFDQLGVAMVGKAAGKPLDQSDAPVARPEQQGPGVRGHGAAIKTGHHRPPIDGSKTKQIGVTLRPHRASPVPETNRCRNTIFSDQPPDAHHPFEKCGLDGWLRRELRCILWRQWKRPRTRAQRLMQRGLDEARAWASANNGRGPWWNAGASHMNDAFRKTFFDRLGLISLLEQHRRLNYAA